MARPRKSAAPRIQMTLYVDEDYLRQIDAYVATRKQTASYTRGDFFHAAIEMYLHFVAEHPDGKIDAPPSAAGGGVSWFSALAAKVKAVLTGQSPADGR